MDGTWREMFENPRGGKPPGQPDYLPPRSEELAHEDSGLDIDLTTYKPWVLQRDRSRPTLMIGLRRFEPRSGLWTGCVASYLSLRCVEYIGDRQIALDFGCFNYLIRGHGLHKLVSYIQEARVSAIQEYSSAVWQQHCDGPIIQEIHKLPAAEHLSEVIFRAP